jgi:ribose 5-phosphate isomerase B
MKIALASDHAGYPLKEEIRSYLEEHNMHFTDFGTYSLDSVDYPDFARRAAHAVLQEGFDFAVIMCGTGIGISIAANKVKGIRAALVTNVELARLAKEHNHANMIAFGGRTTTKEEAIAMLEAYMHATPEMRHQKRIDKIEGIEEEQR